MGGDYSMKNSYVNLLIDNNKSIKRILEILEAKSIECDGLDSERNNCYKIADGDIGTFATVVWAILELDLIVEVDENGHEKSVSSKQGAAEFIFSRLFGEPIKGWRQTISHAFERENAIDIFNKMKNVAYDKHKKRRD